MKKLAITTGDPAGIGPEITSKALRFYNLDPDIIYIVYGRFLPYPDGCQLVKIKEPAEAVKPGVVYWIEIDDPSIKPGSPGKVSGYTALNILQHCTADLQSNKIQGVVTCPVAKATIRLHEPDFIGHTEFFAAASDCDEVIMSFWGPYFNLALLTTHTAVCKVSGQLTREICHRKLTLIHREANKILKQPRLALLALNPHAGELGAFGREDEMLTSVLQELAQDNILIDGPFPADTFFSSHARNYDLIISAYHDQGLIPFKMISAQQGVNVTLGLPFVRTSVDHGTAFDIAGQGTASEHSLEHALQMAESLLTGQQKKQDYNYQTFARFYDKYMEHVCYDDWVQFVLDQYNRIHQQQPERILELACGTASVASRLVRKNLQVEASDLSPEMLKIAAERPFPPILSCRDMLAPLPGSAYDMILLLFDSFNYLLKKQQIKKLFNNIQHGLTNKGIFIFDISTMLNCEENFDGFINLEDEPDQYLIHQSELDHRHNLQITRLTFFLRKGYQFVREDEVHYQKIYPVQEIIDLIAESKLKLEGLFSIGRNDNL
ncbi:MAG: 4-hydroxythreonine-4-phosphate dehydrogenase PdxA, partial [Candidatus Cloacimonetes bacterium]|nr:4-hydroxythreonine-4-phosphate dehydrogenase PdxA [Candidatus Cloacimonadota bacterium]